MLSSTRITFLRYTLIAFGAVFAFGLYPLMVLWPSGWSWGIGHSHYQMMIVSVYFVLGIYLIASARDPLANLNLIWFTIWSSVLHSISMAISAIQDPSERGHLVGDVPILFMVAVTFAVLTPRRSTLAASAGPGARRIA